MNFTIIKIVDTLYEDIGSKTDLPHEAISLNGKRFGLISKSLAPSFSRVFLLFGVIPIFKYTKIVKVKPVEYGFQVIVKPLQ